MNKSVKQDPLAKLMKQSLLETSSTFTDDTIKKLQKEQSIRLRIRLYLLILFVSVMLVISIGMILYTGFQIHVFGWSIQLPKLTTMLSMSVTGYLLIMYLFTLLKCQSAHYNIVRQ